MQFSRFVTVLTVSISFLTLGCGVLPSPKKTKCSAGCRWEPGTGIVCEAKCEGEFEKQSDADQWAYYVDPSLSTMETSGSNVSVVGFFGTGTVTTFDANSSVVESKSFLWTRSGSELVIANPTVVAQAINDSIGQAIEIEYTFDDIAVSPQTGMNVFEATQEYDGLGLLSGQDSWYCREVPPGSPPSTTEEACFGT